MPWDVVKRGTKWCVIKKTTGEVKKCYSSKSEAVDYFQALEINASEHKEVMLKMLEEQLDSYCEIKQLDDGRYWIVAIATAALKDREDETFETKAMDYDIAVAKESGDYPKFTMWHKSFLDIGEVQKMSRIGLFAIDEGPSYDDPFSLQVCKNILTNNDGQWGVSRGFYLLEASGYCPKCNTGLVVGLKQMIAGFKCPGCDTTHLRHKGVLKEVHFRKTRTFEDTITDIPAVPYTGVTAIRTDISLPEDTMTKNQLKAKLLKEGIDEELVDARLENVGEKELKQLGDEIPYAALLKEFEDEGDEPESAGQPEYFVLDPEVLKDFSDITTEAFGHLLVSAEFKEAVATAVQATMNGMELDLSEATLEQKELPELEVMKETLGNIEAMLEKLLEEDTQRMKEVLEDTPRAAKFRILRSTKGGKKKVKPMDEEDEEDEEDMMEEKQYSGVVQVGDGKVFENMTQALLK